MLGTVLLAGAVHGPVLAPAGLTLSIHDGAGAHGPVLGSASLNCHPSGGSHPHAAGACRALTGAGGRFGRLRGHDRICTMIYRPVTAVAYGHWGARPVRFVKTYDNTCRLQGALAPVYDLRTGPEAAA